MKLSKKQAKKYITPIERNYEYEIEVTGIVLRTVVGSFLKVLRDEYGYGKKRLDNLKAKVDFEITSVENQLQDANMRVNFIDAELYKPRQTFLKKLLAYNKKIDEGVLTEEEIEAYSDEWSGGYV